MIIQGLINVLTSYIQRPGRCDAVDFRLLFLHARTWQRSPRRLNTSRIKSTWRRRENWDVWLGSMLGMGREHKDLHVTVWPQQ